MKVQTQTVYIHTKPSWKYKLKLFTFILKHH